MNTIMFYCYTRQFRCFKQKFNTKDHIMCTLQTSQSVKRTLISRTNRQKISVVFYFLHVIYRFGFATMSAEILHVNGPSSAAGIQSRTATRISWSGRHSNWWLNKKLSAGKHLHEYTNVTGIEDIWRILRKRSSSDWNGYYLYKNVRTWRHDLLWY